MATIDVTWFNVEDLRTLEINEQTDRVNAIIKAIVNSGKGGFPNIIGIGEITYDLPSVPNAKCQSKGKNLLEVASLFFQKNLSYVFKEGNIGIEAKRTNNGNYLETREDVERVNQFGDLVNYGLFPGQYNTGFITNKNIVNCTYIKDLQWKDFHPGVNPSQWEDASGTPIPSDCQLFDKLFMDITVEISGVNVHFIVLHTVPASGFGNLNTPNLQRNKDQLAFLQWYLTGTTYFTVPNNLEENNEAIIPFPERDVTSYLAMGDWNADYRDNTCPGSAVLQQLFGTVGDECWFPKEGITNKDPNGSFEGLLDYMVWSPNLICQFQTVTPINEKISDHSLISASFNIQG